MQARNSNEAYYRQVVTVLGIGTLFFLLFLLLISGAVAVLTVLLAVLPLSPLAAKLLYQLTYGALYHEKTDAGEGTSVGCGADLSRRIACPAADRARRNGCDSRAVLYQCGTCRVL